jgi:hypothetical protein
MNQIQLENPVDSKGLQILETLVSYLEDQETWTIREESILFLTNQLLLEIAGLREDGATSLRRRLLKLGTRFKI